MVGFPLSYDVQYVCFSPKFHQNSHDSHVPRKSNIADMYIIIELYFNAFSVGWDQEDLKVMLIIIKLDLIQLFSLAWSESIFHSFIGFHEASRISQEAQKLQTCENSSTFQSSYKLHLPMLQRYISAESLQSMPRSLV